MLLESTGINTTFYKYLFVTRLGSPVFCGQSRWNHVEVKEVRKEIIRNEKK
jgi:hypothetical protein